MKFLIIISILTNLVSSSNDTWQNKLQSKDILNKNVSSSIYLENMGSKIALTPDTIPSILPVKMTLISSGQMEPYTTIKIDGYEFEMVTRNNDTIYVATSDDRFQTPEGYKVGTTFSQLTKKIQGKLTKEQGWGYYYKLPSGWVLGFCEGNSCTDNYPVAKSKVKWIFKRH